MRVSQAGDAWVPGCLRTAARSSLAAAPAEAGDQLRRALAEPPAPQERVEVLRELAAADATAGRQRGRLAGGSPRADRDQRERAGIAHELAQTYAALFRWVEAVDATDRALAELGDRDAAMSARLEAELVVEGMHDARRAHRVAPMMERLRARGPPAPTAAGAVCGARNGIGILTSDPNVEAVNALEMPGAPRRKSTPNWDTRGALLWTLITPERFEAVEGALPAMSTRRAAAAAPAG